MAGVTESVIDDYLGDGTYDWYYELVGDAQELMDNYEGAAKLVPDWNFMSMRQQLEVLQELETDIDAGFERIAAGDRIDSEQVLELIQFFELLRDNVQKEWTVFVATFAMSFFQLIRMFLKVGCKRMLETLKNFEASLKALKEELKKAERKLLEARIDKGIDIIQVAITVLAPEFTIVTNLTIAVGGLVADEFLGTGGPDASKIARTAITTLSGPFGKAMKWGKDFEKLDKVMGISNGTYDAKSMDEIDTAKQIIADVKAKIAAARKHYDVCRKLFPEWYSQLVKLNGQLEQAVARIRKLESEAEEGRDFLSREIRRMRYKSPVIWRLEPVH